MTTYDLTTANTEPTYLELKELFRFWVGLHWVEAHKKMFKQDKDFKDTQYLTTIKSLWKHMSPEMKEYFGYDVDFLIADVYMSMDHGKLLNEFSEVYAEMFPNTDTLVLPVPTAVFSIEVQRYCREFERFNREKSLANALHNEQVLATL